MPKTLSSFLLHRLRQAIAVATLGAFAANAAAQQAQEIPPSLIVEALAIDQAARALDQAPAADAASQVGFFVGTQVPRLLLVKITLQVDTDKPVRYSYGQGEAVALQSQALHKLATAAVAPGSHRLYVEYVARFPEDKPGTQRLSAHIDQTFEKGPAETAIQIDIVPQSLRRDPAIAVRQWNPAANGTDDANLHAIDLLLATDRNLAAASELLSLRDRNGGSLPPDFARRLDTAVAAIGAAPAQDAPGASVTAAQYDAAVSSAGGNTANATAALEKIGQERAKTTPLGWTVRDKANTTLGYYYLSARDSENASRAFRRVRSPGPFANQALLGLGWSLLVASAPAADAQAGGPSAFSASNVHNALGSVSAVDLVSIRRSMPFPSSMSVASPEQAESIRRALVPWAELIGRDPTDPAVQEAMLAIPYVLDHAGAHEQAHRMTVRAIDLLENTHDQINEALQDVASGGMLKRTVDREDNASNGWAWWLGALPGPRWWLDNPPEAPANFYLENLVRNEALLAALNTARRAYELDASLAATAAHLSGDARGHDLLQRIAAIRPRLAAASTSQRAAVQQMATADLQALKLQTERYLVEARFAMARLHDRPVKLAERAP